MKKLLLIIGVLIIVGAIYIASRGDFCFLKINGNYDYLLDLKLWTFTAEKIEDLENNSTKMKLELESLKIITIQKMWKSELFSLTF